MRCPKCGHPAQPTDGFCGRCGHSFSGTPPAAGPQHSGSGHPRRSDDSMTGEWDEIRFPTAPPRAAGTAAEPGHDGGQRPSATAATGLAVTRQGRATAEGTAQDVRFRTEVVQGWSSPQATTLQVLTFRLEGHDARGDRLRPIAVQMRGPSIRGVLSEGENASAAGSYRSGTIHADRIINRTTGAVITASPTTSAPARIGLVVTAIAAIFFVILMISIATSHP
jgi:hypothetical protein